jgi:hypothetical protein
MIYIISKPSQFKIGQRTNFFCKAFMMGLSSFDCELVFHIYKKLINFISSSPKVYI